MTDYMYISECADGSYYVGSTNNLEARLYQHQTGDGANYTNKRLPVELVYCEEFDRIDDAFAREKQVQGWSHAKKQALTDGQYDDLPELAVAYRDRQPDSESSHQDPEVLEGSIVSGGFESLSHRSSTHIESSQAGDEQTLAVVKPVETTSKE
ncbi:MAG: GIY-YIG nuclease family protein [Leptospiraceae bacterium]|nr:GIY-YIG nuclease family protein [Leptospiraceae bacterium]